MTGSSRIFSFIQRGVGIFFLVLPLFLAQPAAAVDVVMRSSEAALLLEQTERLRGLQVTIEVRFLTVGEKFLEQVGVDFSGTVNGQASRRNQPVAGAKIVLEGYKDVRTNNGVMTVKTGRTTVTTNGSGQFSARMKDVVNADSRAEILTGDVISLRIEATGKNGKRVDEVHVRAVTSMGGLIK